MASKLEQYAKELLVRTMREYSEYHWRAGWLNNLEYELWSFACNDVETMWDGSYGQGLQDGDRERLMSLAVVANGWYTRSSVSKPPTFVTMDVWLKEYKSWAGKGLTT